MKVTSKYDLKSELETSGDRGGGQDAMPRLDALCIKVKLT